MNNELKENKNIELLKELEERIKKGEIIFYDCDAEGVTGLTAKGFFHLNLFDLEQRLEKTEIEKNQELLKDFSDETLKTEINRRKLKPTN